MVKRTFAGTMAHCTIKRSANNINGVLFYVIAVDGAIFYGSID